jgi:cell division protein FtsW (lipid II flippase)
LLHILFSLATYLTPPATYHLYALYCTSLRTGESKAGYRLGERNMLWTITIILFILWVVGLVSSYTLGGWIHILLVLAIIVLIFNLMSGRRVV